MEPVFARSTGIDVQCAVPAVVHHFQNVRVARYDDAGSARFDAAQEGGFVPTGIAADVRHQYGDFLACETRRFRPYPSCLGVVYVAVNGPERFEGRDFVGERSRTDVARMPYLVHIRKEPLQGSIENSVRVRYDSYLFHPCKDKPAGRLPYPCGRFFTVPFFRREQFGRPVPVGIIRFTCLIIHIRHVICSV